MRIDEPDWDQISLPDPSGRRGLWIRRDPPMEDGADPSLPRTIELCAGREGDDDYVKISVGDTVTEETLHALEEVIHRLRWAEEHREWEIDWKNPNTQEVSRMLVDGRRCLTEALDGIEKLRAKDGNQE